MIANQPNDHRYGTGTLAALRLVALLTVLGVLCIGSAHAGIVKSKSVHKQPQELQLASHIEYQTSEYAIPFQIEWGPTDQWKLALETGYGASVADSGQWERGALDTEVAVTYEFLPERRNRPSLALQAMVKLPTAKNAELGTKKTDYTLGLVAAKEFVNYDVEFAASYTVLGKPPGVKLNNVMEASLAGEWHRRPRIDYIAELTVSNGGSVRHNSGLGGLQSATDNTGATDAELILGIAEHVRAHWKLEQGIAGRSDGSFQILLGWEYNFNQER